MGMRQTWVSKDMAISKMPQLAWWGEQEAWA